MKLSSFKPPRVQFTRHLSSIPAIINGEEMRGDIIYSVKSHDTKKILYNVHSVSNEKYEIDKICQLSTAGFKKWKAVGFHAKAAILEKAAHLVAERRELFIKAHTDIGVPQWFANFNVDLSINILKEHISNLSNNLGAIPRSSHDLSLAIREPIGPVLSISPWNAPGILGMRSIAAPLAAGCSVIVKSSERSSSISYLLAKCFLDAGLPNKTLTLIHTSPSDSASITEKLIENYHIRKINFTGSTKVGRKIAEIAGKNLKPMLLELGGKNVAIVDKDADLAKAVPNILWSSWCHKGQICMSTERVLVLDTIYDEFVSKCKNIAHDLVAKDKDLKLHQRDTQFSRKIKKLLEDAISKGAQVLFGELPNSEVINPIILTDVTKEMAIHNEETFGPVFFISKVKSMEEAVSITNEHEFGLKCSIWSGNHMKALRYAREIDCGGVHINGSTINDESTNPHGGVKNSGYGRFNSSWGIDEFSYIKNITFNE